MRFDPGGERVERNAQRLGELGERGKAAGPSPRLDRAELARGNAGGGGELIAAEAPKRAPHPTGWSPVSSRRTSSIGR